MGFDGGWGDLTHPDHHFKKDRKMKLNYKIREDIRFLHHKRKWSKYRLAELYGVSPKTIYNIVRSGKWA